MSKSAKTAAAHCRVTPGHWSQYLEGEYSTAECRRCETHLKGLSHEAAGIASGRQRLPGRAYHRPARWREGSGTTPGPRPAVSTTALR